MIGSWKEVMLGLTPSENKVVQ